ncbi:MAG: GMC family oxidoreductase [Novosphingobium sp.]
MLVDARSVPTGTIVETEVCIVGAGAGGITLAREFNNSGIGVVLLESGGDKLEQATQDLYAGTNIGRPYEMFPISRFRFFGGTTNRWGGAWCDLPSPLDYEERDGVPHSGWPFPLSDLEPWYRRAHKHLRLGPFGYSLADWGIASSDIPEPFKGPHFICRVLQQAPRTRFGPHYRSELKKSSNVTVYLHANAMRFEGGENGGPVRQVNVGVLPDGRFTVRARIFIISCGGIETARLLLLSENDAGVGLGNQHDLVGRFFMLHLEYSGGTIELKDPYVDLAFQTGENGAKYKRLGAMRRFVSYICLSDEIRRQRKLPAMRIRFRYPRSPELDALWRLVNRIGTKAELVRDLVSALRKTADLAIYIVRRIIYGRNKPPVPLSEIPMNCTAEQLPNPNSRIGLGKDVDAFGLRRVVVDWQLTAEDQRGIVTADQLLREELERSGFGRLRSNISTACSEWPDDLRGDQHHMGTTRMHRDPKQGVVDENCCVHGVENLFVASSSVFPTSGTFNPTLTILALAVRLADHVKQQLRG